MQSKLLANGLSKRTNHCLAAVGIVIEKEAIVPALKTGIFYPSCWPPTYGKITHREVCRWAGIDPESVPFTWANKWPPNIENGLSYRANNCLREVEISAKKDAVIKALNNGDLYANCFACSFNSSRNACNRGVLRPRHMAPTMTGANPGSDKVRTLGGRIFFGIATDTPMPRPLAT